MTDSGARKEQLAANLAKVEERIAKACAAAGRSRGDVTLIAVTKTYPASDVRLLSSLGVEQVGENRDQEAGPKAAACADLPLTWHFIGQLQTNKAKSVARYASYVHSVDRARLAAPLGAAAVREGREIGALVQVALDAEGDPAAHAGRGGAHPDEVPELVDRIAATEGLRLAGLMTVAPLAGRYAGDARAAFARLAELASLVRAAHPAATMVSAGMSGDLEEAIAAGATHVRIGSAILGTRSPLG
ncbi:MULTISPECIES: YggS family pyridoxal phosphate-dependent enzyme [unclassified Streptomyces]|uniref:YggS family pyridoxal phosphate-dependent enzyme n=1 Tax=unclassified Streptomyces TaxID=2593676 RepID=UPI000BAC5C95|nr:MULTISPECIES: YggS family pyridoxal phosphate-dependent enzyme [unclassified Streptomyces]ASY35410.1 YggS family pyridoxal phosphate enzyme [Streptomyces sp. CLI2509]MYX24523.1 YggS family pyridoxal phosphate-dependent enzyme [Streptomyces sp. SID8380]